jgi:hypothetical protein
MTTILRRSDSTVALFLRHEFLDRREHDTARATSQLLAQIRLALGLFRVAPQQVAATRESREQLAV